MSDLGPFLAILVILAPITQGIPYWGSVVGALTSRRFGLVNATVVMTGLFALTYLSKFGVAGTIFASV